MLLLSVEENYSDLTKELLQLNYSGIDLKQSYIAQKPYLKQSYIAQYLDTVRSVTIFKEKNVIFSST